MGFLVRFACWALGHQWRFRLWKSRALVPEIAAALAICDRCARAADVEIRDLSSLDQDEQGPEVN